MNKDFTHIHNHSSFSFGDAVSHIPSMVKRASELGMKSLALTDHGYGHGLIQFYKECKLNNIKPLLGVEAYFTTSSIEDKTPENKKSNHLILIAQNLIGYKNLIKLLSIASTDGFYYRPRLDFNLLQKYNEGLICSSSCIQGPVSFHLYDSEKTKLNLLLAEQNLLRLKAIFGDRLFFEIQYHFMKPDEGHELDKQSQVIKNGVALANRLGVPIVASNDCHYTDPSQWNIRNIVVCNEMGTVLSDQTRQIRDAEGQYYIKSIDEMYSIFKNNPEYLQNTLRIASMVEEYDPGLLHGNRLPKFSNNSEQLFNQLLDTAFSQKYPNKQKDSEEFKRLEYEKSVISQQGFIDYFLIVNDFISYSNKNQISIGPGRGSAAGSIVSYLLDITTLCPVSNNLIFERFLNPSRISLPDIDIDICKDNRHKVIEYITSKYGQESVSQIITFAKQKGRSSVRTAGRVLEIPIDVQNYVSSILPKDAGEFSFSIKQILEKDPEAPKESIELMEEFVSHSPENESYIKTATELEGIYTHSGVHAAALVIAPEPLDTILPLCKAKDGGIISQYSMTEVEELGLLKMDLLGLDTLSVISNCLFTISVDNPEGPLKNKKHIKTLRDLQKEFPNLEDEKVYKRIFNTGRTIGVFQCDSIGLRSLLSRIKCNSFNDICAAISLYRPGPLDSGIVDSFINRRRKREEEKIWHEELRPYMADTHGLAIYQEQIMFASQVLCGFDLAKADKLRKVIGKKKKEEILAFREEFVNSATKVGKISKEKAESIYSEIEFFGRYCFNLSHAAAYSVISFYTAWLKTYYPDYFMAAILNKFCVSEASDKKNNEELFLSYILETQTMGITIQAPSIKTSYINFRPISPKVIAYGLSSIKGIGKKVDDLITLRQTKGGWKNIYEFFIDCLECGMNKRNLYDLVTTGAIDFGYDNEKLAKMIEGAQRMTKGNRMSSARFGLVDDVKAIITKRDKIPKTLDKLTENEKESFMKDRALGHKENIAQFLKDLEKNCGIVEDKLIEPFENLNLYKTRC